MSRALTILALLAPPILVSTTLHSEPARKDVLMLSIRGDSGSAQRFTIVTENFHVFSRRQDLRRAVNAPDTLTIAGTGSVEIVSADSGKPVVADVWVISRETSDIQRFSGQAIKVRRSSPTGGYHVTDR
jgi:hypothetical protein